MSTSSYADDKIRLNPNYKGPSEDISTYQNNTIITEELGQGSIQFLDTAEDDDQYILLKDPENNKRPIISLSGNDNSDISLNLEHSYQYNPSLSFDLTNPFTGFTGTNFLDRNFAGSRLTLSLGGNDNSSKSNYDKDALSLFFGSSFMNTINDRNSMFLQNGLIGQQAYNVSLGLGYSGFQLGASFSQNDNFFSPDLSGLDLGLGYVGNNWSANLSIGQYNRSRASLITTDFGMFDNISAYELGAAYRLFPNINLTGRFTYYSYGVGSDVMPIDDVKSLIFGTNVSF